MLVFWLLKYQISDSLSHIKYTVHHRNRTHVSQRVKTEKKQATYI